MYLFRGGRDFDLIFWGIRILKGRKEGCGFSVVREGGREGGREGLLLYRIGAAPED